MSTSPAPPSGLSERRQKTSVSYLHNQAGGGEGSPPPTMCNSPPATPVLVLMEGGAGPERASMEQGASFPLAPEWGSWQWPRLPCLDLGWGMGNRDPCLEGSTWLPLLGFWGSQAGLVLSMEWGKESFHLAGQDTSLQDPRRGSRARPLSCGRGVLCFPSPLQLQAWKPLLLSRHSCREQREGIPPLCGTGLSPPKTPTGPVGGRGLHALLHPSYYWQLPAGGGWGWDRGSPSASWEVSGAPPLVILVQCGQALSPSSPHPADECLLGLMAF